MRNLLKNIFFKPSIASEAEKIFNASDVNVNIQDIINAKNEITLEKSKSKDNCPTLPKPEIEKEKERKSSIAETVSSLTIHHNTTVTVTQAINSTTEQRVILNVGSTRFETLLSTLRKYPNSLLGTMFDNRNIHLLKPDVKGEYFFDRNPKVFESVLDFYRNGVLVPPTRLQKKLLELELEFWQIDIEALSSRKKTESILTKLTQEVFHQLKGDGGLPRDILVSRKENFSSINETLTVSELGWTYKSKLDNTSKAVFGNRTLIDKHYYKFVSNHQNQSILIQRLRTHGIRVSVTSMRELLPEGCQLQKLPCNIRIQSIRQFSSNSQHQI